jgi:hypothetical protein
MITELYGNRERVSVEWTCAAVVAAGEGNTLLTVPPLVESKFEPRAPEGAVAA